MAEGFYKRKLIDYIKKNLKKGYPVETLKVALVNQNYSRPIVEDALKEALIEMANEAPALKEKPKIEHQIIIDEKPISEEKSFWKKLLGLFKKSNSKK
jgi:hypothetical protein